MNTPKKNGLKKISTLTLFIIFCNLCTFSQTTCNEPIRTRVNITLCQGETYQHGDRLIVSAGLYIQTFRTVANDCDSIVTLGVDYLNSSNFSFTETITTNESFFFNEQNLTEAGTYRDTLIDTRGCDSMLTLTLEVIIEQENCDNGIDDDGDGLIDAFDADCLCLLSGTPVNLIPNGDFEEKVGCCRSISQDEEVCMDNWVNLSSESIIYHNPECWAVLGQDLVTEGVQLESGFVGGYIRTGDIGTSLSGFSLGICLDEPMYAGNTYQLSVDLGRSFREFPWSTNEVSENMRWAINGIADCETLSEYNFTGDFCSKGLPFENLANISLSNLEPAWNHFELTITPETTIAAIFLGGNCEDELNQFDRTYIFYDNLSITAENGLRIKNEINIVGNSCSDDLQLSIPNTDNLLIDWYKDSLPLPQISSRPFTITPEITPTKNGIYHAKVTFEDGRCQLVGPLVIETFELELPNDTTICPGQNLLLSFAQTGVQYQWQDGSTQSLFFVTNEGLYWVEAKKGDCVIRDSIYVSYAEQRSFLPNDTTVCDRGSFLIKPSPPFEKVVWWENSLVGDSLLVQADGIQHAIIVDQGCSWLDSIQITFDSLDIDLPRDTVLCPDGTLLLNVTQEDVTHEWIDGTRNPAFFIQEEGTYWVESSKGACTIRDSITVSFAEQQSFLPNDTTICDATTFLIAPNPPAEFILFWESSLMDDSLLVDSNGVYHAFILDQNCEWIDSVEVNFVSSKDLDLGIDTTLCLEENLMLSVPTNLTNFEWQDGSINTTQLITQSDIYWLTGEIDNCTVRDSLFVSYEDCQEYNPFCKAYLPNSFSPNGDGINDELQLLTDCELQFFEMEVYDRWGSLLFSTTEVSQPWDGQYRGELLETGVYLWTVRYQFVGQAFPVEQVETVTVVR